MPKFYFTLAQNHVEHHWPNRGPRTGCVEVEGLDAHDARVKMQRAFGAKWAFQYKSLDEVHPLDREILHRLPEAP